MASELKRFFESRFELHTRNRIVPMEGMRGFAALLVFLVHFQALFGALATPRLYDIFHVLGSFGHTGVDVFFVLSGYLMYGIVLSPRFEYMQHLRRRIERLYPVFAIVLLIYVVLSFIVPYESKIPRGVGKATVYLLANLAMLPGITKIVPMITVSWSLSYEWFFYLTLPFVIWALKLRCRAPLWRIVFFGALALGYEAAYLANYAHHPRMIMFVCGILLWEIQKSDRLWRMEAVGECVAIAGFVLSLWVIGVTTSHTGPTSVILKLPLHFYTPLLFVSTFFFTAYALFYKGILAWVFSLRYLRWIGNMSYSFYLTHGLTLHGVRLVTRSALPGGLISPLLFMCLFVLSVAFVLAASAVLYLAIERPLSLLRSGAKHIPPATNSVDPSCVNGTVHSVSGL